MQQSSHLYVANNRYWFDLQENVSRTAPTKQPGCSPATATRSTTRSLNGLFHSRGGRVLGRVLRLISDEHLGLPVAYEAVHGAGADGFVVQQSAGESFDERPAGLSMYRLSMIEGKPCAWGPCAGLLAVVGWVLLATVDKPFG